MFRPRFLPLVILPLLFLLVSLTGCAPPIAEVVQPAGSVEAAREPIEVAEDDWAQWRGPTGDGRARGSVPPLSWNESEHVVWKAEVPGEGHASPIVVGDRVYVATAERPGERQLLLAYARGTGKRLWQVELHQGGFMHTHSKNTHASATPASDGRRIYTAYLAEDALQVSAVDLDGDIVWQTTAGPFRSVHGYGSSPVLFEQLVIVAGDSPGGGFLAGLHRDSGEVVWRQRRSNSASFGTPLLVRQDDRWQLLHNGHESLTSYDPKSGEVLWTAEGPAKTTANTPVHLPGLVVISGGYPQRGIMGVRADGSGEVLWKQRFKAYVPSPLVIGDRVLVVQDSGVVRLYEAESGEELWSQRLAGDFSASPTLAGDYVFLPNEAGTVYVLQPTDEECRIVAENRLSAGGFASPVICGGCLYLRTRSHLYCIGPQAEL